MKLGLWRMAKYICGSGSSNTARYLLSRATPTTCHSRPSNRGTTRRASNRILPGPQPARECLIDNDDLAGRFEILGVNPRPPTIGMRISRKIVGTDGIAADTRPRLVDVLDLTLGQRRAAVEDVAHGHAEGHGEAVDAGQRAKAPLELVVERRHPRTVITNLVRIDPQRQHVRGIEAQVHALRPLRAAHAESGDDE